MHFSGVSIFQSLYTFFLIIFPGDSTIDLPIVV